MKLTVISFCAVLLASAHAISDGLLRREDGSPAGDVRDKQGHGPPSGTKSRDELADMEDRLDKLVEEMRNHGKNSQAPPAKGAEPDAQRTNTSTSTGRADPHAQHEGHVDRHKIERQAKWAERLERHESMHEGEHDHETEAGVANLTFPEWPAMNDPVEGQHVMKDTAITTINAKLKFPNACPEGSEDHKCGEYDVALSGGQDFLNAELSAKYKADASLIKPRVSKVMFSTDDADEPNKREKMKRLVLADGHHRVVWQAYHGKPSKVKLGIGALAPQPWGGFSFKANLENLDNVRTS